MSAADRLRAAGIVNPHMLAKRALTEGVTDPSVFVRYRPADTWLPGGWMVERPGFKTDPGAHWRDRGVKRFDTGPNNPEAALEWAAARYGITEWVKVPGFPRTYFPPSTADLAKRLVKAATR